MGRGKRTINSVMSQKPNEGDFKEKGEVSFVKVEDPKYSKVIQSSCLFYSSLKIMKTTPSKTKRPIVGRLHKPRLRDSKGKFRTSRNHFHSNAESGVNKLKPFIFSLFVLCSEPGKKCTAGPA